MREMERLPHSEPHISSQDPLQQRTAWAISQLATRRYRASCKKARTEWSDSGSSCSSSPVCAICLEEFSEGQVRQGSWLTSVTRLGREAGAWGSRHLRLVWALWLRLYPVYPAGGRGMGQPEVWFFSWSSRKRELLFLECVLRAMLCSGCFRCIISF